MGGPDAMVRRWENWKNPWDREYAKRGRLWRGSVDVSPVSDHAPRAAWALEVGCGDGKFLRGLEAAGYRTVGLDSSVHALRLASDATTGHVVRGDATALPMRDGSFGAVVLRYVLGALSEKGRRLAAGEAARVVAPGGVLFVEDFTTADFRFGKGDEVEPRTFDRNQGILSHYFEAEELRSLFPGDLALIEERIVRHEQKIGTARKPRVTERLVLRRP